MIEESEAKMLAEASANVMQQFDLQPDPKTQAIIGLVLAAGSVYGPRVYLINMRKAQEAAEKKTGVAGVYNGDGTAAGTTTFQEMQPN